MNWARDFVEQNPDLTRWPMRRQRHALVFESPAGEQHRYFVGLPAHWFDRAEGWREIDTTLQRQPDGGFAAPGLPVRVYPDGTSTCGGYAQRSQRVGVLSGRRFYPLATLGPGRVDGDSLIREAPGFRHVIRVTRAGLREELHVERGVSGGDDDLLTVETQSLGRLPHKYRFGRPMASVDGVSLPLTQRGGWLGLPLAVGVAGAILDPDYTCYTTDGYIYGTNATYSTARNTSTGFDVSSSTTIQIGQNTGYNVVRGYVSFDTSGIPDAEVIKQVNLKLKFYGVGPGTNYDVQIVQWDWSSYTPIAAGNRETNYDGVRTATLDAVWKNTSGLVSLTYYTSANMDVAWPSKTGTTYYGLRSSLDYNNTAPTTNDKIVVYPAENASPPILVVVSEAVAYRRTLLGVGW